MFVSLTPLIFERLMTIKIDVEGAERSVIDGAAATLHRHAPVLCIELHTASAMRSVISSLPKGYLVRDWVGSSPTFILTKVREIPSPLTALVNCGWRLLLRWKWRHLAWSYGRLVDDLLRTFGAIRLSESSDSTTSTPE
jgi:hypothetical protein